MPIHRVALTAKFVENVAPTDKRERYADTKSPLALLVQPTGAKNRLAPPPKSRTLKMALQEINSAGDVQVALSQLLNAVSKGEISPDEAIGVGSLLEQSRKNFETVVFEERLAAIEAKLNSRK